MSSEVAALALGFEYSMVLKTDGTLWATGRNDRGQLGDGTITQKLNFVKVLSGGVTAVAASYYHSMVVKQDASLWATGRNRYGELGDGTTNTDRTAFVKVISGVLNLNPKPYTLNPKP